MVPSAGVHEPQRARLVGDPAHRGRFGEAVEVLRREAGRADLEVVVAGASAPLGLGHPGHHGGDPLLLLRAGHPGGDHHHDRLALAVRRHRPLAAARASYLDGRLHRFGLVGSPDGSFMPSKVTAGQPPTGDIRQSRVVPRSVPVRALLVVREVPTGRLRFFLSTSRGRCRCTKSLLRRALAGQPERGYTGLGSVVHGLSTPVDGAPHRFSTGLSTAVDGDVRRCVDRDPWRP